MKKILLLSLWFTILSGMETSAQELPWPKDPFNRDYKVDAAYGARIAEGSFFHKGLDLNGVGGGNTDLNYPLIAEEYGTVFGIGMTNTGVMWIGINYGNHRTFAYLHIFPDNNEDSTGNFVAGTFTRLTKDLEMQSYRRIQTDDNKDHGIILFYSGEDNTGRIVKAVGISGVHNNYVQVPDNTDVQIAAVGTIVAAANSPIVCPDTSLTGSGALETSIRDDDVYDSVSGCILAGPNKRADSRAGFVVPQVYVNSGEVIAPLGRSGLTTNEYAHLHLQISNPDPILHNERDPNIIAPTNSVLFNDGWDNVIQYLVRGHSSFAGSSGITRPLPNSVLYYTNDHEHERVIASIRQRPADMNSSEISAYHNYELDRVRMFVVPNDIAGTATDYLAYIADNTYLINKDREPGTIPGTFPDPADPFRSEFDYGGTYLAGLPPLEVENTFPPFTANPSSRYKSVSGRTGLIANDPITEFVFNQWNTRINKTFTGLASINSEAAYPDGEYKLFAVAESVDRDNAELFITPLVKVAIDNFRPYAEFLEVKDAQGDVKYRRRWTLTDGVLNSVGVEVDKPLVAGGEYTATALFSEFMNEGHLQVESYDPMYPVATQLSMFKKTSYTGSFTLGAGQARDELRPLIITGRDLGANYALKLDPGKREGDGREDPERVINPALELTRNSAGDMQGAGGEDRFHTLRIDAASPVIKYNRHELHYPGFYESCGGGAAGLCGTEDEPIYITYSSVPFAYTDIGSGLNKLTVYREKLGGTTVIDKLKLSLPARAFAASPVLPLPDGKYVQVVTDTLGRWATMPLI